jgi:hypothetical protein
MFSAPALAELPADVTSAIVNKFNEYGPCKGHSADLVGTARGPTPGIEVVFVSVVSRSDFCRGGAYQVSCQKLDAGKLICNAAPVGSAFLVGP